MILSRIKISGTATRFNGGMKFDRSWYSPDHISGWGDDSWSQTTVPKFGSTNVEANHMGTGNGCLKPMSLNGFYPLYADYSCSIQFSPIGQSTEMVFGGVTYHIPVGLEFKYEGNYVRVSEAAMENCTAPVVVDKHYPLYATRECAERASPRQSAVSCCCCCCCCCCC